MTEHPGDGSGPERQGIDAIEADIARSREELAETVDELTARLDVRTRVKDRLRDTRARAAARAADLRERATDAEGRPTPVTIGAGGALALLGIAGAALLVRRRRR